MAMTEDMEYPRLTPPGDRMPSGRSLFRRPDELTDEQFDLLAAARAENALAGDALAELESVIASVPGRMERADSFRNLRLVPGNESWPGMHRSLRRSPAGTAVRRSIIPTLLAAAAVLVLMIYGPAGAKLKTPDNQVSMTGTATMTVAEIPYSSPITAAERIAADSPQINAAAGISVTDVTGHHAGNPVAALNAEVTAPRALPLVTMHDRAAVLALAPVADRNLAPVEMAEYGTPEFINDEKNWMLRSISFLATAITGKEKEVDGYMIASGCITGLNTILGWDMELQQVSNRAGDPVAVSFSSTLLSFTKPLNKSTP